MPVIDLKKWAREIAKQHGFVIGSLLYEAAHKLTEEGRNAIFDGTYQGKPAVLKVYNDLRRVSREPEMQKLYCAQYQTKNITAPEVYASEVASAHHGWMIMERLPNSGHFFTSPINPEERKKFLELFVEYRTNFPLEAPQVLMPLEELTAALFSRQRIDRWFIVANDVDAELIFKGEKPLLQGRELAPRLERAGILINKSFQRRPMIWCHGHFKPKELFYYRKKNQYYLTDFGHMHLLPEGYELGFMVWADWLVTADWRLPYEQWRQGVNSWITALKPVAKAVGVRRYQSIITASLIERCFGALFADVIGAEKPREQKEAMVELLYQLLDDLMA